MKKIFLIGDSIRLGYDKYVQESMANVAEVYFPAGNCQFAESVLRNLHTWKEAVNLDYADVVHFNAGLWDTIRVYGDDIITRPEAYADYIDRICKRIQFLFPGTKTIFATSTPCIESGFIEEFEMRYNKDVEEYNKIACEIVLKHGGEINDLYTLLKDAPPELHSDQTHYYTADATELIGGQVNKVMCRALDIDEGELIVPDKMKYHRTDGKNDTELYKKRGRFYVKETVLQQQA